MISPKVFISYSRADVDWVSAFAQALSAHGTDPWLDIWSVVPGSSTTDQLESALRQSDLVVPVFPPDGSASPNVMFEVGVALGMGKPFIPVVPYAVTSPGVPFQLAERQSIVRKSPADTAAVVAAAIARRVATATTSAGSKRSKGATGEVSETRV